MTGDDPLTESPEVSIIRLAYELGQLSERLAHASEASRARTAERRRANERLRERLGLDDEDDIHA